MTLLPLNTYKLPIYTILTFLRMVLSWDGEDPSALRIFFIDKLKSDSTFHFYESRFVEVGSLICNFLTEGSSSDKTPILQYIDEE